jgi:hypothetical protein
MSYKRRQVLIWLGAAGGFGLSACVRQLATTGGTTASTPQATVAPASPAIASTTPHPTAKPELLQAKGIVDPPRGDVRIVVISDLNSQYGSTDYEPEVDQAIALVPGWGPDLVLCGGDMVAGQNPSLTEPEIQAMWAAFDRHIGAPLRQAKIPYGFTLGNHDASAAKSLSGGFLFTQERNLADVHWNEASHDPGLQFVDKAKFPFYYTFQQNNMFFLVWDASASEIPNEQIAWAERSLASPEAQAAKMRIVIGHLPLYAVAIGRDDPGEYLARAEELRSLLEKYNVHTYISGHDHAYYPGYVGKLQTLHCGVMGSGIRPLLNGSVTPFKAFTVIDINLAAADTVYTTYNATTLEVVDQKTLPKLIASPTRQILRRDLTWDTLTAEEKSLQYTPTSQ